MPRSPTVSSAEKRLPAQDLVNLLTSRQQTIALAESCTCGMAAALIGGVPGASNVFCGSAVTYRASVKQQWLAVSEETISRYTTESREITEAMASGLLEATREADYAAAITGHLGPGAPADQDGIVYVSLLSRAGPDNGPILSESFQLQQALRVDRQVEAAQRWLEWIAQMIGDSA